jgi:hypothetical protein
MLPYADDILPGTFKTAGAEVPMPGNNWDPGGATFSEVWLNG